MKHKIYIPACLIFLSGLASAQNYFQKSLGATNFSGSNDIARGMYQTWDGGFIVSGATGSYGAGSIDGFLTKFDSTGTQLWSKTYGTVNWEATFKLIVTSDSGYLIAGGVFDAAGADEDILLVKTDQNGTVQWSKKYGGNKNEAASDLEGVEQTSDGGYIVTGTTKGYDTVATNNIFLLKTDALGDTLWTRVYTAWNFDQALSVHETFDGGYILSGRTVSFGAGQMDALLIKTDNMGMITWARTYGGPEPEEAMSVKQTPDSGYIFTGATYSFGPGYSDIYIVKTDANGMLQWSKAYGVADVEASYCIIPAMSGGYAVIGFTESFLSPGANDNNRSIEGDDSSNVMVLKIDTAGTIEWTKIYGGLQLDEAYHIAQARDSGYLLSATTRSFGSDSTDNGYIVRTDAHGTIGCYSTSVVISDSIVPTLTDTASFTYTYGFDYSNYPITETAFVIQDNTLTCLITGMSANEPRAAAISITPNPSVNKSVITASGFSNARLFLYNGEGRLLSNEAFNLQSEINTRFLANGIYLVVIRDSKGNFATEKLVKL